MPRRAWWLALWAITHLPGVPVVLTSLGTPAALAYVAASGVGTLLLVPATCAWLDARPQWCVRVAWTGVILTTLILVWLTPRHVTVVGFGSDRNEGVTRATQALLAGQPPYTIRTSRHLPASVLPGELVLAAPIVALTGNAAWMLPILWPVWLASLSRFGSRGVLLGLVLATSAMTPYQALLGEDLLWTGLATSLAVTISQQRGRWRGPAALAIGLALTTRLNLVAAWIVPQQHTWLSEAVGRPK